MSRISRRDFLRLAPSLPFASLLSKRLPVALDTLDSMQATKTLPNILVIVFDALSAKHMSLYGYRRETTPNLTCLARTATVYHRHYASGNYTPPGTASVLTGTLPWTHRAFHLAGTVTPELVSQNVFRLLSDRGYHTIAYTHNLFADVYLDQFRAAIDVHPEPQEYYLFDQGVNKGLLRARSHLAYHLQQHALRGTWALGSLMVQSGYARLSTYSRRHQNQYPHGVPNHATSAYLLRDAIDGTVSSLSRVGRPYFGYFHYYPPHQPYMPPKEYIGMFADGWTPLPKPRLSSSGSHPDTEVNKLRQEYDEHVAYVDAEFGRLYTQLQQAGLLEDTYLFLTSDHGEIFERGLWGHGNRALYEPLLRVPLVVFQPGQNQARSIHQPTSCIDLLPTWARLAGASLPDRVEGEALPGPGSGTISSQRSLFAVEAQGNPKRGPLTRATVAIIRDQCKLVHCLGYGGHAGEYELYDLENDPDELEDLYASHPSIAIELARELQARIEELNQQYEM